MRVIVLPAENGRTKRTTKWLSRKNGINGPSYHARRGDKISWKKVSNAFLSRPLFHFPSKKLYTLASLSQKSENLAQKYVHNQRWDLTYAGLINAKPWRTLQQRIRTRTDISYSSNCHIIKISRGLFVASQNLFQLTFLLRKYLTESSKNWYSRLWKWTISSLWTKYLVGSIQFIRIS